MEWQDLEKRGREQLLVALFLMLSVAAAVVVLALGEPGGVYPASLAVLTCLFAVYAVVKERELSRLRTALMEITTIYKAIRTIDAVGQDDSSIPAVLRAALKMVGATRGSLMLVNELTGQLERACAQGETGEVNLQSAPALSVPLKVGQRVIGVLSVHAGTEAGGRLTSLDRSMMEIFAQHAALVLEHARHQPKQRAA